MTKHRPGEEVEIDARRAMTPARRRRILAKTDGKCARIDCAARAAEIDHVIPLQIGGKDEDDNLEGLCTPHHLAKTRLDLKLIARAKRIRKKHLGESAPTKRPIQSRGFDKRLRKKFDGSVQRIEASEDDDDGC